MMVKNFLKDLLNMQNWVYYIQRMLLHPFYRRKISAILSNAYPKFPFSTTINQRVVDDFLRSGSTQIPDRIDRSITEEIREYFEKQNFYDPYGKKSGIFSALTPPKGISVAYCEFQATINCPHIFDIANSPKILALVAQELGCKPTLSVIQCCWSFANNSVRRRDQFYHRDVDDWKFVKLFVYLTDIIKQTDGPHTYIAGSQLVPKFLQYNTLFDDHEVLKVFDAQNVREYFGPAGTQILSNTFGVHKAGIPRTNDRIILVFNYSMNPYWSFPKASIPRTEIMSHVKLDPYINRRFIKYGLSSHGDIL